MVDGGGSSCAESCKMAQLCKMEQLLAKERGNLESAAAVSATRSVCNFGAAAAGEAVAKRRFGTQTCLAEIAKSSRKPSGADGKGVSPSRDTMANKSSDIISGL